MQVSLRWSRGISTARSYKVASNFRLIGAEILFYGNTHLACREGAEMFPVDGHVTVIVHAVQAEPWVRGACRKAL